MENFGKGVRLPEGSSSSKEDIEMSPPAKSMVDELRSYLDTRIQERMEALNGNARTEPPMVQKDDTTQLLLQILNDQNGRMKKLEQVVSNTNQNIAALVQGMSQKIITRGIEIGQGSGQQAQIEVVTTNVDIPIGYPVNSTVGSEELKHGGHKMPYDFNLEKTDFSLKDNDQFTKDDEESETKSMKWSDINPLNNLTQECKMPYDLHFEKNDFSMENDQSAKDKELSDEKFTNDLTQEIKLGGQELSYDFILGDDDLKWQGNANESMSLLFKDKAYEKLWMSNQVSSHFYVFETKHLHWLLGSHDLKVFSKWLVQKPLNLMFLFEDKSYEKLWMTNQISSNAHTFENVHPHWLLGSHDLKAFSKWLVQLRFYNDAKNKIQPVKWLNQPLRKKKFCYITRLDLKWRPRSLCFH
jgi:hypothetical protein